MEAYFAARSILWFVVCPGNRVHNCIKVLACTQNILNFLRRILVLEGERSRLIAVQIGALLINVLLSSCPTLNTATWGIQAMYGECNLPHSWLGAL